MYCSFLLTHTDTWNPPVYACTCLPCEDLCEAGPPALQMASVMAGRQAQIYKNHHRIVNVKVYSKVMPNALNPSKKPLCGNFRYNNNRN
jgi:hypothetical protein